MRMPRAAAVGLALGALLIASLAGKVAVRSGTLRPDDTRLAADIAARLVAAGFRPETRPSHFGQVVFGAHGACRLAVRPAEPSGETDAAIARDLAGIGGIRFAWQGRLSARPPRWQALAAFHLARERARLGLTEHWAPLLAVADNGRCDEALLRFAGVRAHGRFVATVIR